MSTNSENPQNSNDLPSENEAKQEQEEGFKLPDPDMDNVTVLTDSLPNNPIIPWHHYDSPWEENHEKEEEDQDPENPNEENNNY